MAEAAGGATAPAALAPAGRALDEAAVLREPGRAALDGPAGKALGGPASAPACVIAADPSRFDRDWFAPGKTADDGVTRLPRFEELLREHNGWLGDFALLRAAVLRAAGDELAGRPVATNVLPTMMALYDDAMLSGPAGAGSSYTEQEFLSQLTADPGGPGAYDPWDGWWAGQFANPTVFFNLHIWDPSDGVNVLGYDQHVQAVTQTQAKGTWFGSALGFGQRLVDAAKIDHAINVWSERDGLTGYVHKAGQSLPHLGFLFEPNVLVWFAPVLARNAAIGASESTMMLFVEPAFKGSPSYDTYLIRGARGKVVRVSDGGGDRLEIVGPFSEVNSHRGDYREVMHLRDRGSLRCAIDTPGALTRMEPSFAGRVHRETL